MRHRLLLPDSQRLLLWSLFGFVGLQLGLLVVMEYWRPDYRDRQYGLKLALLRQRLAEEPGSH